MPAWTPEKQRQQAIVRRLRLVGAGPAAYFTDACHLMDGGLELGAKSHLVSHLLREVQSSLLAVLKPMVADEDWPEEEAKESHAKKIDLICNALRVPPEDELRKSWRAYAKKLAGFAHRDGLSRPRPVSGDFELFWDRGQAVLFAITERIEATYAEALPRIEELALGSPDVKAFKNTMLHSTVALDHFFALAGVEWLEPLSKKGFFADPPPLVANEDGAYEFPRWPQGHFLARIAEQAPGTVVEIGKALQTDNPEAQQSLVEAACSIPPSEALGLVEPIVGWLQTPIQWALPFKVRDLIVHLFAGGASEEGLVLARALLTSPEIARGDDGAGEHVAWLVPRIFPAAGLPSLLLLVEQLERQMSGAAGDSHSYIWRPDIANERMRDDRDQLLSGARDGSLSLAEAGLPLSEILAALAQPGLMIGRRLSLYLLSRYPDSEEAKALLLDREVMEDPTCRREYLALAGEAFGSLSAEEQAQLLEWIEEAKLHEGHPERRRSWQLAFLDALGEDLPDQWRARREALEQKIGPLDPDSPRLAEGFRGALSPLDRAALEAMEVEALLAFLAEWEPDGKWPTPSRAGLASILEEVIAKTPETYASEAPAFAKLEPAYIRALFGALKKALAAGRNFEWGPVLALAQRIETEPRGTEPAPLGAERDPDFSASWLESLGLIFHGLFQGEGQIGYELRPRVWEILSFHLEGADPEIAVSQEDEHDVQTMVWSSVRCQALQASCRLAVRDREERDQGLDSELATHLERRLDPVSEPSGAVRSVFGRCFGNLVFADEEWARAHRDQIFPPQGQSRLWRAAWESYIGSAIPAAVLFELLKPQYRRAIEELTPAAAEGQMNDPDESLVGNLISHYLIGTIDLEDPDGVLGRFYAVASTERRAQVMTAIGTGLESGKPVPAETLARMEALAEHRLEAVRAGAPSEELSGFAWWFASGEFEVEWSLGSLRDILDAGGTVEPDHMVAERLSKLSGAYPLETVEILRRLIEGATRAWFVIGARDSIETILRDGLAAGGEAGARGRDLVNVIVAQGATDFARLLDGGASRAEA